MNTASQQLVDILRETKTFLSRPGNDFVRSGWNNAEESWEVLDKIIESIEHGTLPTQLDLAVLFAPTGPIQEVSVYSGWGCEFLILAERFDGALARAYPH